MSSVEHDMQELVVAQNLAPAAPRIDLVRSLEDFAVTHMQSLAFGAAGAVLIMASVLTFSGQPPANDYNDPVIVGSITPASRVPGQMAWQPTRKPVELIALQAPQFDRAQAQYQARSNAAGVREDALIFEPNVPGMPEARVVLRRSAQGDAAPSLFIDMTRQQAERGVAVTRAGTPGKLLTKFGELEVADMTFADDSNRNQSCLAFRSTGAVGLTGWFCGAQGAAVDRPELGCFIDRVALLKSGEDRDLRKFFTEAEQRRRPCPTGRASAGRKPTWLDADGKTPPMRGEVTGSIDKPKR
jgi:hypothetical protein